MSPSLEQVRNNGMPHFRDKALKIGCGHFMPPSPTKLGLILQRCCSHNIYIRECKNRWTKSNIFSIRTFIGLFICRPCPWVISWNFFKYMKLQSKNLFFTQILEILQQNFKLCKKETGLKICLLIIETPIYTNNRITLMILSYWYSQDTDPGSLFLIHKYLRYWISNFKRDKSWLYKYSFLVAKRLYGQHCPLVH